jgi:hypothetical protein
VTSSSGLKRSENPKKSEFPQPSGAPNVIPTNFTIGVIYEVIPQVKGTDISQTVSVWFGELELG